MLGDMLTIEVMEEPCQKVSGAERCMLWYVPNHVVSNKADTRERALLFDMKTW